MADPQDGNSRGSAGRPGKQKRCLGGPAIHTRSGLMGEEQQHRLALPKGTRIRDFEFHRVLGHGGFGITYLGWNITLDIPVAIKEYFPSDLATRETEPVRRSADEPRLPLISNGASSASWTKPALLARFQHPGIVRIHHFFEAHRTAYIAMEYVEGESLSAYLKRKGTLSEKELKGILNPLLSALEVVHRADFLHRDIKPGQHRPPGKGWLPGVAGLRRGASGNGRQEPLGHVDSYPGVCADRTVFDPGCPGRVDGHLRPWEGCVIGR